jgi:hypothetical protein
MDRRRGDARRSSCPDDLRERHGDSRGVPGARWWGVRAERRPRPQRHLPRLRRIVRRLARVVARASSCRKTKTVKRGKRRVRILGESAIAWNQQGRPGVNGVNGANGANGSDGANGATNVVVRTTTVTNATGATDQAECNPGERAVAGGVGRSDGSSASTDTIQTSFPESVKGSGLPAPAGATPIGWHSGITVGSPPTSLTFYVICASP